MQKNSPSPDSPEAERRLIQARRRQVPDNEIPVPLPLPDGGLVTDELALYLSACHVYSTGLELELTTVRRNPATGRGPHRPGREVLLGIEFADGSAVSNLDRPAPAEQDPGTPALTRGGGNGSARVFRSQFFLSPLPATGPVTLIYTLPGSDLPDGRVTITGEQLGSCARRVRELWPWQPEPQPAARPEQAPPAGSWFARHPADE